MGRGVNIGFERRFVTALVYHVLSKLDLGRDAANLYDRRGATLAWASGLEDAYLAAGPERLELQFAGLAFEGLDELLAHVSRRGTPLWARFRAALEAERAQFEADFRAREADERALVEAVARELSPPLARLRRSLWAPLEAPPLVVFHAPALGLHGRGDPRGSRHLVAVSLAQPTEHLLCQIFHEAVHPVSDRELRGLAGRDTRAGAPGSELHRRIEAHAVSRGAEVIAAAMPELVPSYERWAQGAHTLR